MVPSNFHEAPTVLLGQPPCERLKPGVAGALATARTQPPKDTIVAPATASGSAALAVVRVDGPLVPRLIQDCSASPALPRPRRARRFQYRDLAGQVLDDGIATYFAAPHSFTGGETWEMTLHGNPLIVDLVLADLVARGCRWADPGEFTRRAFLSGKLDLSQAEAVAEVIQARSAGALAAAQRHLRGELGRLISGLAAELIAVLAHLEAYLDFPDEDLPPEDHAGPLRDLADLAERLEALAATRQAREFLIDGLPTVIVGAPNAGKSSLLNALLGQQRALVSPIAGTTRDYLSERLTLGRHLLRLIDTAGLHPSDDPLEMASMERSRQQLSEAALVVLVIDAADQPPGLDRGTLGLLRPERLLVLLNKADLPASTATSDWLSQQPAVAVAPRVTTSLTTVSGQEAVRKALIGWLDGLQVTPQPEDTLVNARHAEALQRAATTLRRALAEAQLGRIETAATEVRLGLDALGEVVGRIDSEAVLDQLFKSFCIGK